MAAGSSPPRGALDSVWFAQSVRGRDGPGSYVADCGAGGARGDGGDARQPGSGTAGGRGRAQWPDVVVMTDPSPKAVRAAAGAGTRDPDPPHRYSTLEEARLEEPDRGRRERWSWGTASMPRSAPGPGNQDHHPVPRGRATGPLRRAGPSPFPVRCRPEGGQALVLADPGLNGRVLVLQTVQPLTEEELEVKPGALQQLLEEVDVPDAEREGARRRVLPGRLVEHLLAGKAEFRLPGTVRVDDPPTPLGDSGGQTRFLRRSVRRSSGWPPGCRLAPGLP